MLTRPDVKSGFCHLRPEIFGVVLQFIPQLGGFTEHVQHDNRGTCYGGCEAVGKQVGAAALPEHINDFLAAAGESATRTSQSLTQGPGNDVDPAHHTTVFVSAPASLSQKT